MPDRLIGSLRKGAAALFLLISSATMSNGEDLTVWTHPLGAFVQLQGPTRIQGISPVPLDSRMNGEYTVRARLGGYEEARGRFTLRSRDGSLTLSSYKTNLRQDRLFRSLLLPGYGQLSGGRRQVGLTWMTACLGFGFGAIVMDSKYQNAHDAYVLADGELQEAAQAAAIDREAIVSLIDSAFAHEVESNNRRRGRDAIALATAALWAGNLVDAVFFHGGLDVREGSDGVVQIGLTRKSRTRRMVRSALLPGLGQSYSGNPGRGALYSAAAVMAGIFTLESHLDWQRETDRADAVARQRSELAKHGFLTAELSEGLAAKERSGIGGKQDEYDRRNVWAAITAGIWAASLLDAAFLGPAEAPYAEPVATVSYQTAPYTRSPGIALRFQF